MRAPRRLLLGSIVNPPDAPVRRGPSRDLKEVGWRAFATLGGAQLVKLVLNVIGTITLVRMLSPADFGVAAMAAVFVNFVLLFKDLGFGTAIVQSSSISQRMASTFFWLAQLAGVMFGLMGVAFAPLMAQVFSVPELAQAVTILSLGFLLGTLGSQHAAWLARDFRFASLAAVETVALCLSLATALTLASIGYGWWSLIWQRLVQIALTTLGLWLACSWRPSMEMSLQEAKSPLKLSLHVVQANMATYLTRHADNLLIGWYWGPSALGLYSKAYDLFMAPLTQVSSPLGQTLQPLLARLRDKPEQFSQLVMHAFSASFLILLPVGVLMVWQAADVTLVLLGESWAAAAPVISWLGLAVCFQLGGSVLMWSLVTRQRGADLSRTSLINAAVNLGGFIVSVPYGIVAVAATYVMLGIFVRIPYALFVCSGDELFPRAAALRALGLPLLAFCGLSVLFVSIDFTLMMPSLALWQRLLLQLLLAYVCLLLFIHPTDLGRFIRRTSSFFFRRTISESASRDGSS